MLRRRSACCAVKECDEDHACWCWVTRSAVMVMSDHGGAGMVKNNKNREKEQ